MAINHGSLSANLTSRGVVGGRVRNSVLAYENDYENLINKPSINDTELNGDLSLEDLGIPTQITDLSDVVIDDIQDGQILKYDEATEKFVNADESSGAVLENDMTTSISLGGIASGTEYEEGTSLEKILRNLLNPVLYPTFTNPSVSLSATGTKLLEKGATLDTTFTAIFSRGSISPAYGTSGYRSGVATGYSLNGGASQQGNTWNVTITEALTSYSASVSYAEGEQPKDSIGEDYDSPLPAGSVNSNTVSYEFVNALWSNDSNITVIAKESLVSKSSKVKQFNFPDATVANPEVFDVPASWTVIAVEVLNTLSGQWESCISEYTVTDTTHNDAGGNSTNYKRYTCNLGYAMGARSVRVKWS